MENSKPLPTTQSAIHNLVNVLVNSLLQIRTELSNDGQNSHNAGDTRQSIQNEKNHVRDSIIDLLDQVANGKIIKLNLPACRRYISSDEMFELTDGHYAKAARFCVLEGLCKAILNRRLLRNTLGSTTNEATKQAGDQNCSTLLMLLERYWPDEKDIHLPGYKFLMRLFCSILSETISFMTYNDQTSFDWHPIFHFFESHISISSLQSSFQNDTAEEDTIINGVILALFRIASIRSSKADYQAKEPFNSDTEEFESWGSQGVDFDNFRPNEREHSHERIFANIMQKVYSYLDNIWNAGYKFKVTNLLRDKLQADEWKHIISLYANLTLNRRTNNGIANAIVSETLPTLFQRLMADLPPATSELRDLLSNLASAFRFTFYKPIFTCIRSNSEKMVVNSLILIISLRQYLSGVQMWMRDSEMMTVIILGDVGRSRNEQPQPPSTTIPDIVIKDHGSDASSFVSEPANWRSTTLGQCAVVSEFIWAIKELRSRQKDRKRDMEDDEIAKKFLIDLERQLSIILNAKEKTKLIPLPLRVLVANMFLEMRFFCNTTHKPGWLGRSIEWCTHLVTTSEFYRDTSLDASELTAYQRSDIDANDVMEDLQRNTHLDDVAMMFQRLRMVYATTSSRLDGDFESVDFDRPVSVLNVSRQTDNTPPDRSVPASSSQSSTALDVDSTTNLEVPIQIQRFSLFSTSMTGKSALDISPPPLQSLDNTKSSETSTANKKLTHAAGQLAKKRLSQVADLNQDPYGSVLSLLVAVFATIGENELARMAQPLWTRYMDDKKHQAFPAAAFLLMQCGEKAPESIVSLTTNDLYSKNPMTRLSGLRILSSLFGYRFNILTQNYIPVTSRRLPFRSGAGAVATPFVLTDLGNSKFTLDEPRWMSKFKHSSNFPVEIKRQIQELGWDENEQSEEHDNFVRELTPLAILPLFYLDEEEEAANEAAESKAVSNQVMNNPKNTIKGNKGAGKSPLSKRRAATVPALSVASLSMVDLLDDSNGGIFNNTRELIDYFLRDDPSMFLRVFLGDLSKAKIGRQKEMLTRLRILVNMQAKLPPAFAHQLLNFLAGMLKWYAKEGKEQSLGFMNLVHPLLAELIFSMNDLATRDLRKNKIEYLLASTGHFWFKNEQPATMFPRQLQQPETILDLLEIPVDVFRVTLLRISHYQFLTNFLIRFPREVYAVKKTMTQYEPLPTLDAIDGRSTQQRVLDDDEHFFPVIKMKRSQKFVDGMGDATILQMQETPESALDRRRHTSKRAEHLQMLSALRARAWLKFVDTLLSGLNKNYNDRDELEKILTGVNSIIITHHQDFELLGQALTLYTRVASKFKRLFSSNRGYSIILPPLFKVFCECEDVPIRSAIIFVVCRFVAIHEEAFMFQMLGCLVPLILSAEKKSVALGRCMSDNLFELLQCMSSPPRLGATSDVLGVQLQFELDEHGRLVQQQIDNANNPIAVPLSKSILKPLARSMTAPMVAIGGSNVLEKTFAMEDSVKLFLTIIAYDTGALRAEQFVIMFRQLLVHFMKMPELSELINEGVSALINVFYRFARTARPSASVSSAFFSDGTAQPEEELPSYLRSDFNDRPFVARAAPEHSSRGPGKNWLQNDRLTIKKEFIRLISEYHRLGGTLNHYFQQRVAQIIKLVIKDSGLIRGLICPTGWIRDYIVHAMLRIGNDDDGSKIIHYMLQNIYSQFRQQWRFVDAADLYDALATVLEKCGANYIIISGVAPIAIEKYVCFGLSIAVRHDWEPENLPMQRRFHQSLVRLILALMEYTSHDVLQEIEKQIPSATLIGVIIIPICLQYNLKSDYSNLRAPTQHKKPLDAAKSWKRLLGIVMRACSKANLGKTKAGGFSLSALTNATTQQESQTNEEPLPEEDSAISPSSMFKVTFVISFTALKIILLRGGSAFDEGKKLWLHIAIFVQQSLYLGENFAITKSRKTGMAVPASPQFPPSPDIHSPDGYRSHYSNSSDGPGDHHSVGSGNILATDSNVPFSYARWTFLEFAVSYKQPLILYMRTFIHQKLYEESQLHNRQYSPRGGEFARHARSPPMSAPVDGGSNHIHRWKSWGGPSPATPEFRSSSSYLSASDAEQEHIIPISLPSPKSPQSPTSMSNAGRLPAPANLQPGPPFTVSQTTPDGADHHHHGGHRRLSHASTGNSSTYSHITLAHTDTNNKIAQMQAQTTASLANLQRFMGYQVTNTIETSSQLMAWSKPYALQKLINEWRFVSQTYPHVFYITDEK
ncbi:hypothetical protein NQZ79_g5101 [Umbelopsis isabellina]|nr:hypothetical protein NQZ79_g5101 [Umbelopsis isabellina]